MELYESNRPPVDDSGLSGAVGFKLGEQVGVQSFQRSVVSANYLRSGGSGGGGTIYTLSICVDGVPKFLDVYADGEPY
jgi:hypothetical protein